MFGPQIKKKDKKGCWQLVGDKKVLVDHVASNFHVKAIFIEANVHVKEVSGDKFILNAFI